MVETTEHALVSCQRARLVWEGLLSPVLPMESLRENFKDRLSDFTVANNLETLSIAAVSCWAIWNDRNNFRLGKPNAHF